MGLDHGLTAGWRERPQDGDDRGWDEYYAAKRDAELITWRKENHFHRWFVNNVQSGVDNCENHRVTLEQLRAFVDAVRAVHAASRLVPGTVTEGWTWTPQDGKVPNEREGQVLADHTVAQRLLPTQSGFFFGGTDYDEWYYKSLTEALEKLEPVLDKASDEDVFTYWSSW
jgi:hypothetical protein